MSSIPDNSQPEPTKLRIEVLVDTGLTLAIERSAIEQAAAAAASSRGFNRGEIGIRVADDNAVHDINRKHLNHDHPTDVISFAYEADAPRIEGEIIVSAETAQRRSAGRPRGER